MRLLVTGLALALAACGSSGGPTAQQSQTPSPTPTLPPVATDEAAAKQALLTAAELGTPWVQPKKVNEAKKAKGERCPGQKNAGTLAPGRAKAERDLTRGTKAGADIASFGIRVYGFGEEQAWRDAVDASEKGCASWKSLEGAFVTLEEVATPPAVPGADEVIVSIERIYADAAHKTLYYVRHYYEARTGRVVTTFELAYIQPKADPTGKDLAVSAALLAKQVAKTKATFGL